MNTKLKDLSLLDASEFLKAPKSLDASNNESFDVMGESRQRSSVRVETSSDLVVDDRD